MKRRVLLLRLDAIGDFILFTSVLPHMRQIFRNDHITLAVHPLVAPLAGNCPHVDEVLPIEPERYANDAGYVKQVVRKVRGKFDVVINTMYARTWQSDNIIARTHAPVKIGFECIDNDRRYEQRVQDQILYTSLVPAPNEWMFEIERYGFLLKELGVNVDVEKLKPDLWIQPAENTWAEKFIARQKGADHKFAIIFPGAGSPIRYWSNHSFANVIGNLIRQYDFKIMIAGSEKDTSIAEMIQAQTPLKLIDVSGQTTLRQFAALVKKCHLFVGTESAGFHFAWALGIPTVGIFGGGHFGRFTPTLPNVRIVHVPMDCYHCYWHCMYDEVKCITSITPEMVMSEIENVLKTEPARKQKR